MYNRMNRKHSWQLVIAAAVIAVSVMAARPARMLKMVLTRTPYSITQSIAAKPALLAKRTIAKNLVQPIKTQHTLKQIARLRAPRLRYY